MLKATLRSFLAHKGRLLLSALAVVLSVAFVAGSLIFSDTVTRTFDRLFASTSADVVVNPKDDLDSQVSVRGDRHRARLARGAGRAGRRRRRDPCRSEVAEHHGRRQRERRRSDRPPAPPPSSPTGRSPTAARSKLTSGHAPHGAGEALLDADTADKKHVRIGDTLTVQPRPGPFKVRIVGIATFTTTNPGAALRLPRHPDRADEAAGRRRTRATSISVDAAEGVSDATAQTARRRRTRRRTRYDVEDRRRAGQVGRRRAARRIPRRHQVRDARIRRDRRARRRVPDRQHLLDAHRPTHPRTGPVARAGRRPAAGTAVRADRGAAARPGRLDARARRGDRARGRADRAHGRVRHEPQVHARW